MDSTLCVDHLVEASRLLEDPRLQVHLQLLVVHLCVSIFVLLVLVAPFDLFDLSQELILLADFYQLSLE